MGYFVEFFLASTHLSLFCCFSFPNEIAFLEQIFANFYSGNEFLVAVFLLFSVGGGFDFSCFVVGKMMCSSYVSSNLNLEIISRSYESESN